jgi:hypothetical protein
MPLVYPNIVPENNLRLPDAVTIKHGPARLLAPYLLESDKAARRLGIALRVRHDFDELLYTNQHYSLNGAWYPLLDSFNPEITEITPENGFWISGENDVGEIVATWAARVFDWQGTTFADQARTVWYGRDLGQACIVTAPAAKLITGVVACAGASWVRRDFRGKHLSHILPRTGKAYACSRWPLDWAVGYIGRSNVDKGLAKNYGQKNLSYSVYYPDSPHEEQVLSYTPVAEVYADLANFLAGKLPAIGRTELESAPLEMVLEHMVTKTSSEGVFHGSISRS